MNHRATSGFWRKYEELPLEIRQTADKQFLLLLSDPEHPSLQFKYLGDTSEGEVWSARITRRFRVLAIRIEDGFLWFWAGDHEAYDRMIRGLHLQ